MKKVFTCKKFLILLLSALLFFLSACGTPEKAEKDLTGELTEYENTNEAPTSGGTLRLGFVGSKTLNPLNVKNQNNLYILNLIFDSLFQISPSDAVESNLCERYVISPDGLNYEFVIKKGIHFHNGVSLTANDVDATLAFLLAGDGAYKNKLSNIADHHSSGASVFVTLDKPVVNFTSLLDFPILSAADLTLGATEYVPNGTGRYKVQSYKVSKELFLTKNENYHKSFSPYISEIHVDFLKDNEAAVSMLENFQIDLLTSDVLNLSGYTPKRKLSSVSFANGLLTFIGFNNQNPALLSSKTRQALSMAIDRTSLLQATSVKYASVTDLPFPTSCFWYDSDSPFVSFDSDGAHKLLSDDGWQDSDGDGILDKTVYGEKIDLVLNILVNDESVTKKKIADFVNKSFDEIGVKSQIVSLPFADYQTLISERTFDVFVGQTQLTPNYDISFLVKTDENVCGISNERIDQALNALVLQESTTQKQSLFYELGEVLKTESQIAGLYIENRVLIFDPHLKGNITPSNSDIFYGIENWFISEH
ncbi:MAG: ABC transporter substrate-binding protein [Ruminococcaceae bacterium]|nr:ABC transporter substrate-binding protein [Oscillospiraceae bacterium]